MNDPYWDLNKIFLFFKRYKIQILIPILIFMFLGAVYAQLFKPSYTAIRSVTLPTFFNSNQERINVIFDIDELIRKTPYFTSNSEILRILGSYEFVELRGYGDNPQAAEENLNALYDYIVKVETEAISEFGKPYENAISNAAKSIDSLSALRAQILNRKHSPTELAEVDYRLAQISIQSAHLNSLKNIEVSKPMNESKIVINPVSFKKIKFTLLSGLIAFITTVTALIIFENIKSYNNNAKKNDAFIK